MPEDKALRVYRFHHATVSAALELIGASAFSFNLIPFVFFSFHISYL